MTLRESRLKRKLAHATVAHSGVALAAIGALTPPALAAAATYEAGYAAAAGALFFAIAILRTHANEYDAKRLRGAGSSLPFTGAAFGLATLALAALCIRGPMASDAGGSALLVSAVAASGGAATGGAFGAVFARTFLGRRSSMPPRRPARAAAFCDPYAYGNAVMLGSRDLSFAFNRAAAPGLFWPVPVGAFAVSLLILTSH